MFRLAFCVHDVYSCIVCLYSSEIYVCEYTAYRTEIACTHKSVRVLTRASELRLYMRSYTVICKLFKSQNTHQTCVPCSIDQRKMCRSYTHVQSWSVLRSCAIDFMSLSRQRNYVRKRLSCIQPLWVRIIREHVHFCETSREHFTKSTSGEALRLAECIPTTSQRSSTQSRLRHFFQHTLQSRIRRRACVSSSN